MTKHHRWGDKAIVTPNKSEQPCLDCEIVKVFRNEWNGVRPLYWTEFWRGLDRIECVGTPACENAETSMVALERL